MDELGEKFEGCLTFIGVILVIALIFLAFGRGIFASESLAVRTLEAQGYGNIEIIYHGWLLVGLQGCDMGDAALFTARATNQAGRPTQVYVCTGVVFKGGTIRVK